MRRTIAVVILAAIGGLFVSPGLPPPSSAALADEGWEITAFEAAYAIAPDGTLTVSERIEVDFGTLAKHGILRDLTTDIPCSAFALAREETVPCPDGMNRHYDYTVLGVNNGAGRAWRYALEDAGHTLRARIGDPDVVISGRQVYVIEYRVTGALDSLSSADQLLWNVSGRWPAEMQRVRVTVALPARAAQLAAECYQGEGPSSSACEAALGSPATFRSTRTLEPGEEVTVRLTWKKGAVAVGPPLYSEDRTFADNFTLDAVELGGAAAGSVAAVLAAFWAWMRYGRDRRYTTVHYLTGDAAERVRPLLADDETIVVEFTPPDGLRPAQLTHVINEEVGTRDVTATIVDLAVRGYLRIDEEKTVRRLAPDSTDWKFTRLQDGRGGLLPYETALLDGLFESGDEVEVSALKKKFVERLNRVKRGIVNDSVSRKWFARSPGLVTGAWLAGGLVLAGLGVGAAFLAGGLLDRALLGVPLVAGGLVLAALSPSMPSRTAAGSEARRRALGFRVYVETAETRQHEFNERQGIFAEYLPYAIAFDLVDRWAKAFEGLADTEIEGQTGWYAGTAGFNAAAFSSSMNSMSSGIGSAIASSASSSGSGVGGFSGGGGGGGGGGSW